MIWITKLEISKQEEIIIFIFIFFFRQRNFVTFREALEFRPIKVLLGVARINQLSPLKPTVGLRKLGGQLGSMKG